jgi:hypothetical protein
MTEVSRRNTAQPTPPIQQARSAQASQQQPAPGSSGLPQAPQAAPPTDRYRQAAALPQPNTAAASRGRESSREAFQAGARGARQTARTDTQGAQASQRQAMEADRHFQRLAPDAQRAFRDALEQAPTHQDRIAIRQAATQERLADLRAADQTARATEVRNAVGDSHFRDLNPELRQAVVESAATGRGTAPELLDAATFRPGPGVQIAGISSDAAQNARDEATLLNMVRRSMVRSPSFRDTMNRQNPDASHPIRMEVGRDLQPSKEQKFDVPAVFGDNTLEPFQSGVHRVDLADLEVYPSAPGRGPRPNAATQDQQVVHFMTEARVEAHGSVKEDNYDRGHAAGRVAENDYRREVGQTPLLRAEERRIGTNLRQDTLIYSDHREVFTRDTSTGRLTRPIEHH